MAGGLAAAVGRSIAALPAPQRAVVLEVDVLGHSLVGACRRLGLAPAELKRRLAEGRRLVAEKLRER